MHHHALAILNTPTTDVAPHDPTGAAFTIASPDSPHLSVLDLGATRGDGVFETISVGDGWPQALDHHLRRFAHSAAMLELPVPDESAWRAAIDAVVARLGDVPEAWIRIVLTRGIEGEDRPSGWAYGACSADFSRVRTEGIRVVTLDRGYRHDVEASSPWLLAGAKTLSYAVNRAALREAARRDADDVIFVSSDGIVLEGPTSTVLVRRGDLLITPGPGLGILDGTTQASIFRYAESRGMPTGYEHLGVDDLQAVDAAWLVSSVRLAAPVRAIDGVPMTIDVEFSREINEHLRGLRD